MANTSSIFSGNSRFASDFSSVIDRAVAIASLPIRLLQQQKAKLDSQASALTILNSRIADLQGALSAVESAFGSASFNTTVTNGAAVTLSTSDSADPGAWTLSVDDLGSSTAFVVSGFPAVADPGQSGYITGSAQTLLVDLDPSDGLNNPEIITLRPAGTSLRAVVDEVNRVAGSKVQASIVNIGTSSAPQYQLSLRSRNLSPVDITFTDDARQSANTALQRGSAATYSVNGASIRTDSRTVTLAPGVTAELRQTSASPFNVSVERSAGALSGALGKFAEAFNAVLAELDKHRGENAAALAGDSILGTTWSALRSLASTTAPSGSFSSLTDLGLGFRKDGTLYLDQNIFNKAAAGQLDEVRTFLGVRDGSGLLKGLNDILSGLTKSGNGIISSAIATTQKAAADEQKHIDAQQDRVDQLQKALQAQIAAADATIAMLEQQVSYMNGMWSSMNANSGSSR